jgi:hypothetical protein
MAASPAKRASCHVPAHGRGMALHDDHVQEHQLKAITIFIKVRTSWRKRLRFSFRWLCHAPS